MKKLAMIAALLSITSSCAEQPAASPSHESSLCAALSDSSIEVFVEDYKHAFKVRWTHSGIEVENMPAGTPTERPTYEGNYYADASGQWGPEVSSIQRHLIAGSRLSTPYLLSPDHSWLLAAAYPVSRGEPGITPSVVALIDMAKRSVVATIPVSQPSGGVAWIESFAWHPRSEAFAVLKISQVEGAKSLKALISPHPALYQTFEVMVYDIHGNQRCSTTVARDITTGSPRITWR